MLLEHEVLSLITWLSRGQGKGAKGLEALEVVCSQFPMEGRRAGNAETMYCYVLLRQREDWWN